MSKVEISKPIDIILCDSNPLVLSAMSETFEEDPRFSLVATSSSSEGFLATILRIEVQICIIDWNIRDLGAEKIINLLRSQSIPPRTIIYGTGSNPDIARQAMGAGAAAFVSRSSPIETLIQTCLDVAAGKMVFPFLDVRDLQNDPINTLSPKERIIIEALSEGLTNMQLSKQLEISSNTVKFHISNIFDKLNVKNRAQAIAYYYKSKSNLNE